MKGLSVALSVLLLLGAQQLAAYLKRSGLSPAQRAEPGLPVQGTERHPATVLHT
jgi:hypothetical protein